MGAEIISQYWSCDGVPGRLKRVQLFNPLLIDFIVAHFSKITALLVAVIALIFIIIKMDTGRPVSANGFIGVTGRRHTQLQFARRVGNRAARWEWW